MTSLVQWYKSTDRNMPPLSGTVNALPVLLNALLVDGPGFTVACTSITKSGTTATVTLSTADMKRLRDGMVLTFTGCTGADASLYNITAGIAYSAGASTFTYNMAGTPAANATGSPVVTALMPISSITKVGSTALVTLPSAFPDTTIKNDIEAGNQVFAVSGCTGADASLYNVSAVWRAPMYWLPMHPYTLGWLVTNYQGNVYICKTAGTSTTGSGVTGTGTGITDGGCTWDYVGNVGNTYFTYALASTPSGNATGTLMYGRVGLGWTKPFSAGTDSQTYRSADVTTNQFYCQVVDHGATAGGALEAQIYGGEAMSADQTVTTGQFPTTAQFANGLCVRKSNAVSAAVREWSLVGDGRGWKLFIFNQDIAGLATACGFGHFFSYKPGDGFNTFVAGQTGFNTYDVNGGLGNANGLGKLSTAYGLYLARLHTQSGNAVQAGLCGYAALSGANTGSLGSTAAAGATLLIFPNPADKGLYISALQIADAVGSLRGRMPGYYQHLHDVNCGGLYDVIPGFTGSVTLTVAYMTVTGNSGNDHDFGSVFIDPIGPWV